MDPVEVTARFSQNGEIHPREFRVESSRIRVTAVGRRWTTEEGIHILVLDAGSRAHHLLFVPGDAAWYLIKDITPPRRAA